MFLSGVEFGYNRTHMRTYIIHLSTYKHSRPDIQTHEGSAENERRRKMPCFKKVNHKYFNTFLTFGKVYIDYQLTFLFVVYLEFQFKVEHVYENMNLKAMALQLCMT